MRVMLFILAWFSAVALAGVPELMISDGQVRVPMPGRTVTAGYLTFTNNSDQPLLLTEVKSDIFAKVELHQHVHRDGVMRMERLAQMEIVAQGSLQLQPGGLHLMLFEPNTSLEAGQQVPLLFIFSDGRELSLSLPLVPTPKR